jgi:hypothetical protein
MPAVAVMGPLLVPLCLAAYVVAGWVSGRAPFWTTPDLTLSEAVIVRDAAETLRLIQAGRDPNRTWPVRAELSETGRDETMTPLEAAVEIRRLEIVDLLLRHGAALTAADRSALIERAQRVGGDDVTEYLQNRK